MFIGNMLEENRGNAITAGGLGHNPSKVSVRNIFASNTARNNEGHNGGQYNIHHGATLGDFWTDNHASGTAPAYAPLPNNVSQAVVFEPSPLADL